MFGFTSVCFKPQTDAKDYDLVRDCKQNAAARRLSSIDTLALFLAYCAVHWNTADGSLSLLLNLFLSLRSSIPVAEKETSLGDLFLELFPSINLADVIITELESLCIYILLNIVKKVCYDICNTLLLM